MLRLTTFNCALHEVTGRNRMNVIVIDPLNFGNFGNFGNSGTLAHVDFAVVGGASSSVVVTGDGRGAVADE